MLTDKDIVTRWHALINRLLATDGYIVQGYSNPLKIGQVFPEDEPGFREVVGEWRVIGTATYEDAVRQATMPDSFESDIRVESRLPPKGYFYYKTVTD